MPKSPAQHHDDLIAEILYDVARHGAVSVVGIVATLLEDAPEESGGPTIARDLRMVELRAPKTADRPVERKKAGA